MEATTGSSPLARGLLSEVIEAQTLPGIIPARAGFTRASELTGLSVEDHPRSRGVYSQPTPRYTRDAGSSPLARGLQAGSPIGSLRRRIIPARAGFTRNPHRGTPETRDHPRSRGVYLRGTWTP